MGEQIKSQRMSCSMTIDAVKARTKTVTRRHVDTWKTLKPGDRLTLIEKGMGLPKGAKQVELAKVEVTDVCVEDIGHVWTRCEDGADEMFAEGLPEMSRSEFIAFWLKGHGYPADADWSTPCRRIAFRYLDAAALKGEDQ